MKKISVKVQSGFGGCAHSSSAILVLIKRIESSNSGADVESENIDNLARSTENIVVVVEIVAKIQTCQ